jgi:hypothetical protein
MGLYHDVDCWMNRAAARVCEWRIADAEDGQTTLKTDSSYISKISSAEQAGEIALDIRIGRQHMTVKQRESFHHE